ncbi:MAG TPA: lipopolysaccharide transport periplasmic protein LptA [Gallionellaceae bacterium]|nr:lipopolysaccharide transport periplasmic protein LptA [Gallionellaceae bacterium]
MNPLKNNILFLLCLLLSGHAVSGFAERADREKPMQMEADRVTVDDANQTSTFEGSVQMRQGTLLIEASKIVVTQDKKGYSRMTATGQPAHFRQKRDGASEYADGFGERIEYDSNTEIANFYGQARVKREGDDVRGEHIIYNTKSGIFQVFGTNGKDVDAPNKGRVTIVIQPKDKAPTDTTTEVAPGTPAPPNKPSTTNTAPQP